MRNRIDFDHLVIVDIGDRLFIFFGGAKRMASSSPNNTPKPVGRSRVWKLFEGR